METIEEPTHAFVLRIWVEHREENPAEPIWRGVMQHVASGERIYFDKVKEVGDYLKTYLEAIGIKSDKYMDFQDQHFNPTVQGGSKL